MELLKRTAMTDQIKKLERDVKRLKIYTSVLAVLLILLAFAQFLPPLAGCIIDYTILEMHAAQEVL